jgi:hypothetical protein
MAAVRARAYYLSKRATVRSVRSEGRRIIMFISFMQYGVYNPAQPPTVPSSLQVANKRSGYGAVTTLALGEEGGYAPPATTLAVGEEGGGDGPTITTQALGEEGGGDYGSVTTQALGEEGGNDDPPATTLALGEEGGGDDPVTTLALGEEGGGDDPVTTKALGEEGGGDDPITTQALGEEGGGNNGYPYYPQRMDALLDRMMQLMNELFVSFQGRKFS